MQKRVYIVHTGGTLGMQRSPHGYTTVPGHLAELLAGLPELSHAGMPEYSLREYDPLLDSSYRYAQFVG